VKQGEIRQRIERAVERFPGASVTFDSGKCSRHPVAILAFAGKTFRQTFTGTASDHRSVLNDVAFTKRKLRELGAVEKK